MFFAPPQRGIPQKIRNAGNPFELGDNGFQIYMNSAGAFNIPANASVPFAVGTAISFYNPSAACTITITTDTLRFAADGTVGTRTIAQYAFGTISKESATVWVIIGSGIT